MKTKKKKKYKSKRVCGQLLSLRKRGKKGKKGKKKNLPDFTFSYKKESMWRRIFNFIKNIFK